MPRKLIDTHAHLCDDRFAGDLSAVIDRATAAGVLGVVAVGETLNDAESNLTLAREHSTVFAAAGLYPTHLDLEAAIRMEAFIEAHREELVAIGEVGLDRWVVKEDDARELQREIFERFIALAKRVDLPLNIHSRSAGRRTIDLLLAHDAKRVQLHAFDGRASVAERGAEAGFLFSIPPSVVRSRQKQKMVERLPLASLMLETDSPVLGAEKSARNEPSNVTISLEAIAELKGLAIEEVEEAVTENTQRLYRLPI